MVSSSPNPDTCPASLSRPSQNPLSCRHGERPLSLASTLSSGSSRDSRSLFGSTAALPSSATPPEQSEDDIDLELSPAESGGERPAGRGRGRSQSPPPTTTSGGRWPERREPGAAQRNGDGKARFPASPVVARAMAPDPKLTYLDRVVMEIIETERMYVKDPALCFFFSFPQDYLAHIIDMSNLPIQPEQVCGLFGNIEDIYEFNSELLQSLDMCESDPVAIARCFVDKREYFDIYTQYCTNYPNSVAALTDCMGSKTLATFFQDRQAALKRSLPLGSYLLKPVQRILKYHLLLQEIAKHFDSDEEGYEVIQEAINTMTGVAWYINDMKRKHEHAVRVQEIQSLLINWKGPDLTTYGELVLEGTFHVLRAKNTRTLFLFERMLLITKKRGEHYVYKTHISCSTLMLLDSAKDPLLFSVIHFKHPKQPHTVQAKSVEEKRLWAHQIKRLILENHNTIIPQQCHDASLFCSDPGKYHYSPERLKKAESFQGDDFHLAGPSTWVLSSRIIQMEEEEEGESDSSGHQAEETSVLTNGELSEEEEEALSGNASILPSSVLDQASVIAERFIGGLSRRSSLVSEDLGSPACPSPSIENDIFKSPSACVDLEQQTQTPARSPPEPKVIGEAVPSTPAPALAPNGRAEEEPGSTLSKRDRLLIRKIRRYYQHAENEDASFSIKRRESLSYIPAGLVRHLSRQLNSVPQEQAAPAQRKGLSRNRPTSWSVFDLPGLEKIPSPADRRDVRRITEETLTFPPAEGGSCPDSTSPDKLPKLISFRSSIDEDQILQDMGKMKNKVFQLARQYSQRIKSNRPIVWPRNRERANPPSFKSLPAVREERIQCRKKGKPDLRLPLNTCDHSVVHEERSPSPVQTPGSGPGSEPGSPETDGFCWPAVHELRTKYTDSGHSPNGTPACAVPNGTPECCARQDGSSSDLRGAPPDGPSAALEDRCRVEEEEDRAAPRVQPLLCRWSSLDHVLGSLPLHEAQSFQEPVRSSFTTSQVSLITRGGDRDPDCTAKAAAPAPGKTTESNLVKSLREKFQSLTASS
uniref:Pleckstrin homology and RhoGEF domain containing G3 n=1 Tax=Gasterosteus aculeatus aculeatus TaxID=481459 RepID=A0AAQ4PIN0_GASAC